MDSLATAFSKKIASLKRQLAAAEKAALVYTHYEKGQRFVQVADQAKVNNYFDDVNTMENYRPQPGDIVEMECHYTGYQLANTQVLVRLVRDGQVVTRFNRIAMSLAHLKPI